MSDAKDVHDPPLLYAAGRDVGEYVPIGSENTEYGKALRLILVQVLAHNQTMEYRKENPAKANSTGCYMDVRTSKMNCFPCASMDCEPKPLCCKTTRADIVASLGTQGREKGQKPSWLVILLKSKCPVSLR